MAYDYSTAGNGATRNVARPPSPFTRHMTDSWTLEILSALFGTLLVVALCVFIHRYDGHPVPAFGSVLNTDITLNFVVSLVINIAIPALMFPVAQCVGQLKWIWYVRASRPLDHLETFDEASRGIFGGASFLWKMRARYAPLPLALNRPEAQVSACGRPFASMGALLAVLQLIVAPLAQNALLYPLETTEHDKSRHATVPVVETWFDHGDMTRTSGKQQISVSRRIMGAIQNGIFSGDGRYPHLRPSCSTGNCTIGPYRTLGVCSYSADVRSSTTYTPGEGWRLPGGAFLEHFNNEPHQYLSMTSAPSFLTQNPPSWDQLQFYDSIAFKDFPNPIADVFIIHVNWNITGTSFRGSSEWLYQPYISATEFVLGWCVQTLNSTVENGHAKTELLESYRDFKKQGDGFLDNRYLGASPPPDSSDGPGSGRDITYRVDLHTHYNWQLYFQANLNGSITPAGHGRYLGTSDIASAFWGPFVPDPSANGTPDVPLQKGLDMILQNIAMSMTNEMRGMEHYHFHGVSKLQHTIVRVQFWFLMIPVVFMALCLFFFGATLWYRRSSAVTSPSLSTATSRHHQIPIHSWKNSSLAVLRALESELQGRLGAMTNLSALQQQAQKVTVGLDIVAGEDGTWRLTGRDKESEGLEMEQLSGDGPARDGSNGMGSRTSAISQSEVRAERREIRRGSTSAWDL